MASSNLKLFDLSFSLKVAASMSLIFCVILTIIAISSIFVGTNDNVGNAEGFVVGLGVGLEVGIVVGLLEGTLVGVRLGENVGDMVGR
jgi:uncharacterized protein YebE (UPF0316 family)